MTDHLEHVQRQVSAAITDARQTLAAVVDEMHDLRLTIAATENAPAPIEDITRSIRQGVEYRRDRFFKKYARAIAKEGVNAIVVVREAPDDALDKLCALTPETVIASLVYAVKTHAPAGLSREARAKALRPLYERRDHLITQHARTVDLLGTFGVQIPHLEETKDQRFFERGAAQRRVPSSNGENLARPVIIPGQPSAIGDRSVPS